MAWMPEAPEFRSQVKGYARDEVDRHLESVRTAVDGEIAKLEQRLSSAEAAETAAIDRAYFYILDVRSRLLSDANQRARTLLFEASNRAAEIRAGVRDGIATAEDSEALLAQGRLQAEQTLSEAEVHNLVAFLEALTDPRSRDQRDLIPESVPSGLPVAD